MPQINSTCKYKLGKSIGTETKNKNMYSKSFGLKPQEGKAN